MNIPSTPSESLAFDLEHPERWGALAMIYHLWRHGYHVWDKNGKLLAVCQDDQDAKRIQAKCLVPLSRG